MVEVFKTNVTNRLHAKMLVDLIHDLFPRYQANFDLEDCDKILRVKSADGIVKASVLIDLMNNAGFRAEVLTDDETVDLYGI